MGADKTIRVWSISSHAQLCGFDSQADAPECCAFLPDPARRDIAIGFHSGRLRIFDTAKIELVQVPGCSSVLAAWSNRMRDGRLISMLLLCCIASSAVGAKLR